MCACKKSSIVFCVPMFGVTPVVIGAAISVFMKGFVVESPGRGSTLALISLSLRFLGRLKPQIRFFLWSEEVVVLLPSISQFFLTMVCRKW